MKQIFSLLILLTVGTLMSLQAQSFKVIVNNDNAVTSLTKKEASDFFLKKKSNWVTGTAVMPVDLSSSSAVRESFSKQVHGKTTAAIRNFWQQAAFSGAGTAPAEKATDADVLEYVKKNPGAIGYVSAAASTAGVKTVPIK